MENEQVRLFDDTQAAEQEIAVVVEREYDRTKQEDECGSYIKPIKNRHEGYGYIAECIAKLRTVTKQIDGDLKDFLMKLSQNDDIIVRDVSSDIYGHATQLAIEAVKTAAVAKRIIYDVLSFDEQLPIEAALNDAENGGDTESEDIDYNEAETN